MFNTEVIPTVLKNYNGSIAEPTQSDVLCGKDTTLARHPGNQLFREKIQTELPHYLKARSKQDKMKITKSIVQFITVKQRSRFLKLKGNGSWVEIDSQAARDKVSHALRFAARQQKKMAGEQSDDGSSQGSVDDASSNCSVPPPPPPMPGRQEMERNTTDVQELFKAFEQPLTGGLGGFFHDQPTESRRSSRRESGRLMLSFLSSIDFEDEYDQTGAIAAFSFDEQEKQILAAMGGGNQEEVTQWATC